MIELKRSSVEIGDGVRQLITNQKEIFNKGFFNTVQFLAGGERLPRLALRHQRHAGTVFVQWKDEAPTVISLPTGALLDRPIAQMCDKARLLDLIRQFHYLRMPGRRKAPGPINSLGSRPRRCGLPNAKGA